MTNERHVDLDIKGRQLEIELEEYTTDRQTNGTKQTWSNIQLS